MATVTNYLLKPSETQKRNKMTRTNQECTGWLTRRGGGLGCGLSGRSLGSCLRGLSGGDARHDLAGVVLVVVQEVEGIQSRHFGLSCLGRGEEEG